MFNFFRLCWRMLRLIFRPQDSSPIGGLGAFVRHKSVTHCINTLRQNPQIAAVMKERYLAPGPTNLEALAKLPMGTLGYEYVTFLKKYNLNPNYFPSIEPGDDDVTWMRKRGRETHDIWHLVTGFEATEQGEMGISAFYIAQLNSPLNAILIAVGFIVVVIKQPQRLEELMETIIEGWNRGRQAAPLFAVKWEELWARPLVDIRRELRLINVEREIHTSMAVV